MNQQISEANFFRKMAFVVILCFAVIRCLIAFSMELGTDEAYYWFYSQDIKGNYFDHPPMVALWIRAFTANLLFQNSEGFVRLGSVLSCAIASWALFKTGETIRSSKAGFFAVSLYNASFCASITAGIFMMPDAPQMLFYTLALWSVTRITKNDRAWLPWLAFGLAAGFCIMSKVYGAFLWAGLGLFVLLKKREWLSLYQLYASILLTAIVVSPVLAWNFQNDFLTFQFHSDRLAVSSGSFDLVKLGREIVNQVLYNNPFCVVVAVAAVWTFHKMAQLKNSRNDALTIFNYTGLLLIIFLLGVSFFRDTTLPHWSGPGYIALIPLSAIHLANQSNQYIKWLLMAALGFLLLFLLVWQYLIHAAPELIGVKVAEKKSMQQESSIASRLISGFASFQLIAKTKNTWAPAGEAFAKLYRQETGNGIMEKNAPVVCYDWGGAHIEYYFCRPSKSLMIGLGQPNDLHEYFFMNAKRKERVNMRTAYCIVPVDDSYNVQEKFSPYYQIIGKPSLITVMKEGKPGVQFYVYRLRGWKGNLPIPGR